MCPPSYAQQCRLGIGSDCTQRANGIGVHRQTGQHPVDLGNQTNLCHQSRGWYMIPAIAQDRLLPALRAVRLISRRNARWIPILARICSTIAGHTSACRHCRAAVAGFQERYDNFIVLSSTAITCKWALIGTGTPSDKQRRGTEVRLFVVDKHHAVVLPTRYGRHRDHPPPSCSPRIAL